MASFTRLVEVSAATHMATWQSFLSRLLIPSSGYIIGKSRLSTSAKPANKSKHSNIDRYLAIFLALREDDWFDNPDQNLTDPGTWSIKKDAIDTPQSDLAPFHNENGEYWKSDDVRKTFPLGYTYPELQPWDPRNQTNGQFDPVKYKKNINDQLTQLYDNHTQWALRTESKAVRHEAIKPQPAKPGQRPLPQAAAPAGHEAVGTSKPSPDAQATHDDYVVNVLYDK